MGTIWAQENGKRGCGHCSKKSVIDHSCRENLSKPQKSRGCVQKSINICTGQFNVGTKWAHFGHKLSNFFKIERYLLSLSLLINKIENR